MREPIFDKSLLRHTIFIGIVCLCLFSCVKARKLHAPAISDRALAPILDVDSVSTLISDSGITRYRITAPRWLIYDKASPSFWCFPKGIYLEKFSEDMQIDASLIADSARYLDSEGVWELWGNVHAVNERGETFDTPLLIWEQCEERIHSDSSITITRDASVIIGVGFESNQTMTQYTILQPTGYFPVESE